MQIPEFYLKTGHGTSFPIIFHNYPSIWQKNLVISKKCLSQYKLHLI
jgi:hypothetical protein